MTVVRLPASPAKQPGRVCPPGRTFKRYLWEARTGAALPMAAIARYEISDSCRGHTKVGIQNKMLTTIGSWLTLIHGNVHQMEGLL